MIPLVFAWAAVWPIVASSPLGTPDIRDNPRDSDPSHRNLVRKMLNQCKNKIGAMYSEWYRVTPKKDLEQASTGDRTIYKRRQRNCIRCLRTCAPISGTKEKVRGLHSACRGFLIKKPFDGFRLDYRDAWGDLEKLDASIQLMSIRDDTYAPLRRAIAEASNVHHLFVLDVVDQSTKIVKECQRFLSQTPWFSMEIPRCVGAGKLRRYKEEKRLRDARLLYEEHCGAVRPLRMP